MEKRRIIGTEIDVSEICLGTMTFGTPVGEKDAISLVRHAVDKGINFIDTANIYEGYTRFLGSAGGLAEEYLGKAVKGIRDKVVIATKVGMKVGDAPEDEFASPAAIRKQLDKSLKRLGTDYIDIYYLHKHDPYTPPETILESLDKEIKEGKIRHYGISNYSTEQLEALITAATAGNLPKPVMCQHPLSLLMPEALNDIIPFCAKAGISVIPFQVLQQGLLTGKYKRGMPLPPDSRKSEKDSWVWELTDDLFDRLEAIQKKADKEGLTMTQYAIRWALRQPAVASAILGVKRNDQIDAAVEAVL